MRGRLVRVLAGVAAFLTGYAMQENGIDPFAGFSDPRVMGLLLEALGLLLLLSPLLGRRRLPEPRAPRIRREHVRPPCCDGDEDEDEHVEKPRPDEPADHVWDDEEDGKKR